jgi:hypothetical protein
MLPPPPFGKSVVLDPEWGWDSLSDFIAWFDGLCYTTVVLRSGERVLLRSARPNSTAGGAKGVVISLEIVLLDGYRVLAAAVAARSACQT